MGHWYNKEGNAQYEVERADKKGLRATTLADARKLNLVPSVTTILGIIDKPMLTRWKINEVLEACMDKPYNGQVEVEYKAQILGQSEKKGKNAANRGNEIHNALEQFYSGGLLDEELESYCRPVIELLEKEFGIIKWEPELSFSHSSGFGGKCDLQFKGGNGTILDFKTKSAEDFSKVKPYQEHCMQLVAYREGFNLPKAECFNLFISANQPGKLLLHKWSAEDCTRNWEMFKHILEYWKLANKFIIKGR